MKSNFYLATFNMNIRLATISIGTGLSSGLSKILAQRSTQLIPEFANSLEIFSTFTKFSSILCLTLILCLLAVEATNRYRHDNLNNYLKSVLQTFKLRRFLRQIERSDVATLVSQSGTITTYNPITRNFNKTVRRSVIDIRNGEILVDIHIPRGQQAQKLLKEMTTDIREVLTRMNQDYYFSNPRLTVNHLYFEGTKR